MVRSRSLRLRLLLASAVAAAAAGALAASCSATGGASAILGGEGDDAGGDGPEEPGLDVSTCPKSCSLDLTQVLDCHGAVVETCPPGWGCSGSGCVDGCQAAFDNKSSYGCDFWAVPTDIFTIGPIPACFAAFVANTWTTPIHIAVERDGSALPPSFLYLPKGQGAAIEYTPYDPAVGLPPGEVAILFLSHRKGAQGYPPCPKPPALDVDPAVHGTGRGLAFHITTDGPVIAYQLLPYGGGKSAVTSATLLYPTSAWGEDYIAVNAYGTKVLAEQSPRPSLDVLAHQDDTLVTLVPVAEILPGPGVAGAPAGVPVTYALDRGEYVQFSQFKELTGSLIQANKPVGVWGAHQCLYVRTDWCCCDTAQQQIPPVRALGSEYVAVRHRARKGLDESPPWRIVGAADGTALAWEPSAPPGAPSELARGEVAEFEAPGPFVVRSQDADHPFYVGAYMTGSGGWGNSPDLEGEGDAEWVNVIPPAQYLKRYVFFTDPTYSETDLVVVRSPKKGGGFAEVVLDCAGALGPWQAVGPYQYTRVTLVTGNFESVAGCENGRHEIWSEEPFGVTVWGWGSKASTFPTTWVSYAYPAGASVKPINDVVLPVPK